MSRPPVGPNDNTSGFIPHRFKFKPDIPPAKSVMRVYRATSMHPLVLWNFTGEVGEVECSSHGHSKGFVCVCDPGWSGSDCSEPAALAQEVDDDCYNPGGETGEASCAWYSKCLAGRFPACTDHVDNYAESYGERFCQAYTDHLDRFSEDGRIWVNKVKLCLQKALVHEVLTEKVVHPDCTALRAKAFDSHPACYLKPDPTNPSVGICSLLAHHIPDLIEVFRITHSALLSIESMKQIRDVAKGCAKYAFDRELGHPTDYSAQEWLDKFAESVQFAE